VHTYADVHPEPTWSGPPSQAWGHVDRAALREALLDVPLLRAEHGYDPARCVTGGCAWCGREESRSWHADGHVWADGTEAPLCAGCHGVYVAHGEPGANLWAAQREGIAEAVTGVPVQMGESAPAGLLAYAEVAGDFTAGGQPWEHLPAEAVEAYRWATWGRFDGRYAPPEHRAEAVARAAEREAAREAKQAEREAEEAARADVHGFGRNR